MSEPLPALTPTSPPAGHRQLPRLPKGFDAALAVDVQWLRRHHDPTGRPHSAALEIALTLLIAGVILFFLLACLYVVSLALAPRPEFVPTVTSPLVRPRVHPSPP